MPSQVSDFVPGAVFIVNNTPCIQYEITRAVETWGNRVRADFIYRYMDTGREFTSSGVFNIDSFTLISKQPIKKKPRYQEREYAYA